MLSKEAASVAVFILKLFPDINAYYDIMPESFKSPAVYFPCVMSETSGDTLNSFSVKYSEQIKFFGRSKQEAFDFAQRALLSLKAEKNLVSLVEKNGVQTREKFRLCEPSIETDGLYCAALNVSWIDYLPFGSTENNKMEKAYLEFVVRN